MKRVVTVKDLQEEFHVSETTAKRYRVLLKEAGLLTPISKKGKRTAGDMEAIREALLGGLDYEADYPGTNDDLSAQALEANEQGNPAD